MPIAADVCLGDGVVIHQPELVNLYGCSIGDQSSIGPFVEIQQGAVIGKRCKISSHTFICSGVTLADEVFVGHGVMFCNDRFPRAARNGQMLGAYDWQTESISVEHGASIGSGAVILPGVTIGLDAMVAAGAVVTRDVPARMLVAGSPARPLREVADLAPDA